MTTMEIGSRMSIMPFSVASHISEGSTRRPRYMVIRLGWYSRTNDAEIMARSVRMANIFRMRILIRRVDFHMLVTLGSRFFE